MRSTERLYSVDRVDNGYLVVVGEGVKQRALVFQDLAEAEKACREHAEKGAKAR